MSCAQRDANGHHTNPKRERGFRRLSPRSRFGLVWPVGHPSVNRSRAVDRRVTTKTEEGARPLMYIRKGKSLGTTREKSIQAIGLGFNSLCARLNLRWKVPRMNSE